MNRLRYFSRLSRASSRVLCLIGALTLISMPAQAQLLEDGFMPEFAAVGGDARIETIIRLANGQLMVGGLFETVNGVSRPNLVRLHHDGTIDQSFDAGTGPDAAVRDLAVQTDGLVLAVGDFTAIDGTTVGRVARLNPDGSLDQVFSTQSSVDQAAHAVALQTDGSVLVGGEFTLANGVPFARVARFMSNGSLDASFSNPGGEGVVRDLIVTDDGAILAGGDFANFAGQARPSLVRLNNDGTLDASFVSGISSGVVRDMSLLENGDLVIAGSPFLVDGTPYPGVVLLGPVGSTVQTFAPSFTLTGLVHDLAIQNDGMLLLGGGMSIDGAPRNLLRLFPDGAIDDHFSGFAPVDDEIRSVLVESAQSIVIGGLFSLLDSHSRMGLARLLPDGSVDQSFENAMDINGDVFEVAHQPAGQIVVAGNFSTVEATPSAHLTALEASGVLDPDFDSGVGTNRFVRRLLAVENGDTLVSGGLTSYAGQPVRGVFRVSADGQLDSTFDVDEALANDNPLTVRQRPDGRVFLAGAIQGSATVPLGNIVQLHADGSIDTSFDVGSGANDLIWSSALQADDKVVIGGSFTEIDGVTRNGVARLNADGSLDTGFDVGLGVDGRVEAIVALASGEILIGGRFRNVDGTETGGLARLNSDGSLDSSFTTSLTGFVADLDVLANGKILVAGNVTSVGGQLIRYLAVLHADGSRDLGFGTDIQPNVQTFVLEPTHYGKAVIGGLQTMMGGQPSTGLDRFTLNDAPGQRLIRQGTRVFWQLSGSMPMPDRVYVDLSTYGVTFVEATEAVWIGDQWQAEDLVFDAGWQYLRLRGFNPPSMPVQYVYRIHAVPKLIPSQESVSFGPQEIGITTTPFPVQITNDGDARLTGTLSTDLPDFGIDPSGCGFTALSLLSGESCTLQLTFTPGRRGQIDGTLFIDSDDPDSPLQIALTGNGFGAEIVAQFDVINLGNADIGQTSDASSVIFENIGELSASVTQIQIGGPHAADFEVVTGSDGCTGNTLIPDQLCGLSMVFTPSAMGRRQAILEVTTTAFNSPVLVLIEGNQGEIFMDGFE